MATRTFEEYFDGKTAAVGQQSANGDDILILRGGSVLKMNMLFNKAFAKINHNASFMTITTQSTWYPITGLTEVASSASFSFANDAFTYLGPTQIYPATITVSVTLSKFYTGNGGEEYEIGIFVNDTLFASTMSATIHEDDTQPFKANVVSNIGHILTQGDVIDVRILNRSGTDDVKVEDLQLMIAQ